MILTPEEQKEYRDEIDYLIETRGYEYVWGKETPMDKVRAFSRDAPSKVMDGINKIVTNPTVIDINNKLATHAAKLNAEDEQKQPQGQTRQHNPMPDGLGGGDGLGGLGGFGGMQECQQSEPRRSRRKKKPKKQQLQLKSQTHYQQKQKPCHRDDSQSDMYSGNIPFGNHPLGSHPLGEHPLQRKGSSKNQGSGLHFGGDRL
jgi:hypothetical protein